MTLDTPEHGVLETFIRFDTVAAALSSVAMVVVALTYIDEPAFWVVPVSLFVLVALLLVAGQQLGAGRPLAAFTLVAVGNWAVAIAVPSVLPFLWPVLAVAALVPVVLAAPTLGRRAAAIAIGVGTLVIAGVAIIGLLGDDSGVIDDVDDDLELIAVVGALAALAIPIGLVVSQANTLQRRSLLRADALNANLRKSEEDLAASRRRVVDAADTARIQIEQDLHDGAQQHLVALGVHLRLLESRTNGGAQPDDLHEYIAALVGELDLAIDELRELAHGIYPPLLEARGLAEAFGAVSLRSPIPITVLATDLGRFDRAVESALYFVGLEAIANALKHAPDAHIELTVRTHNGAVHLTVTDDGPGFDVDECRTSVGMLSMHDRTAAVGGSFTIESTVGAGARVLVQVPATARTGS